MPVARIVRRHLRRVRIPHQQAPLGIAHHLRTDRLLRRRIEQLDPLARLRGDRLALYQRALRHLPRGGRDFQ